MRSRGPGIAKAHAHPFESRERVLEVLEEVEELIDQACRSRLTAMQWGDSAQGRAAWIQPHPCGRPETLAISWNYSEINQIEIEPRPNMSFSASEHAVDPAAVAELVLPMLWKHIRSGGTLPPGIERFAHAL